MNEPTYEAVLTRIRAWSKDRLPSYAEEHLAKTIVTDFNLIPHANEARDALRVSEGARMIAAERDRQVRVEGWTAEHDDAIPKGYFEQPALPQAAATYAVTAHMGEKAFLGCQNPGWPWAMNLFKPASPIRMLAKAGALIAAEIDRRLRAGETAH